MDTGRSPNASSARVSKLAVAVAAALALAAGPGAAQDAPQDKDEKDKDKGGKRASLSLKVNPSIAFSPARVVVTAELRGGSAEDPELYCPNVEWDWGDGTVSEASENCEPFEAGKSTIKRRWTTSHTFNTQGNYRVMLRLKRGERTVAAGNASVQVKAGVRDISGPFDQP